MTLFLAWVPAASRAAAEVCGQAHEMAAADGRWWAVTVPGTPPDATYAFGLDWLGPDGPDGCRTFLRGCSHLCCRTGLHPAAPGKLSGRTDGEEFGV